METCTTCGANLRPGARFCTTCGTRVHQQTTDDGGWGAAARSAETDSQQTSVLQPVAPSAPEAAPIPALGRTRDWGSAYEKTEPAGDPASRFVTALDSDVKPVDDSGWGAPAFGDDTYPTWNFNNANDDAWKAPEEQKPEESPIVAQAPQTPAVASEVKDEAAARALKLLAELQQLIPDLAGPSADEGAAAMTLTEASLKASDFSDLRMVITQVKDDPRDIKALGDLAEKIDRLEALIQEHAMLTEAIESALHDLGSA